MLNHVENRSGVHICTEDDLESMVMGFGGAKCQVRRHNWRVQKSSFV
ncbi:MAG: hypothetical protein MKZ63_06675 [Nitrospinales bacterium]|nr:hypothetical protein [Nitrospinales bacterium]